MTEKPMGRIVQISVAAGGADAPDILYALCADGTLWRLYNANQNDVFVGDWRSMPLPPSRER